jgi:glycerate 2-kinase
MAETRSYERGSRRLHAESILRAAIAAADPVPLVQRALQGAIELESATPVRLLAIGKAAPAMASAAADALDNRITGRLIVAPHGTPAPEDALFGAHPAPDTGSLQAGRAVLDLLRSIQPDESIVVLLSGGASATVALPLGDISIDGYADCVMRLLRAGADIHELNIVRKHIDALKGGRMAVLAAPAQVLGLVLSDVVGDPVDVIASAPLTADATTCDDALHVLRRHDLLDVCERAIIDVLENCPEQAPADTHPAFENTRVRVIGGNDVAVEGAAAAAEGLGYRVQRAVGAVTGAAREAGVTLAREARRLQREARLPACIVAGGETTVAVRGDGVGGRNQEIVLAGCIELESMSGITIASIGTDGIDGNSDAAGAIADEASLALAQDSGIDLRRIVENNDSYRFFEATDGLVITGATGTNVNDVQLALVVQPDPVVEPGAPPPPS